MERLFRLFFMKHTQKSIMPETFPDFCFAGFGSKHLVEFDTLKKVLSESQIEYQTIASPEQVYSDFVRTVEKSSEPFIRVFRCDALVTKEPGVVLTVKTADCLPLVFADPVEKIVGIAHCGWRGSFLQIARNVVSRMSELGSDKKNIQVAIGPGINSCCYAIHGDRLADFRKMFPEWADDFLEERDGKTYINLTRLNYHQLVKAGVLAQNIEYFPFCTSCDSDRYLSYVRGDRGENMIHYIGIR